MDDVLTDEQRMLVDASARFIARTCPLEKVREGTYAGAGFAAAYRRQAGELGWYSLLVPDELGGGSVSGNGVLDAALVAYHRGRALQPGPFVGTNVVAYALAAAGAGEQTAKVLPALLSGETSAAWVPAAALVPPSSAGSAAAPPAAPVGRSASAGAVSAVEAGGGWRLSGQATFVEDPGPDGWFLVTASTGPASAGDGGGAGLAQFLLPAGTPGLRVVPLESLDLTRRFVRLDFDDVPVASAGSRLGAAGDGGGADELVARQLALACVLTTAESVGAMDFELAMTVQYAKDRIAFGRPIGSFQALKHVLADTSLALEMSKAITTAAAQRLGEVDGSPGAAEPGGSPGSAGYGLEAASMAKAFVGDSGVDLAQNCFQVFGGIGFTWEHDQHLFLRRLTTDAALFGDPSWHRERLCQLSGI
ncbi:acyl-CoA/acyl-ACP dehydrogenase [Frankia sp. CNm7]|uniref:Acyl-CoA/acyl-ACP dehydrogenase n=1 Tax=Frankia nepalensis TaxID=1836974 RepID=A0A937RGC7_9ACTN|nr:acyl-CoA dehydrogenase family protein [Frankia nepalensis]MBL7500239.1 acyl-CoA/acyl-ACP dehydrogenase [Frankia nepalensis]MBL7514267.1 acyl-CoA/acyl-ACP dehydrogenase [Frankia nepalensis]MBL7523768.1 acyl-CoA/acyl-ACP dehydrogenase [Frankia nepalensis]MBL7631701.1 acyl-CoA/acyl-ACP dehydrogenase [Frankia nepalensis]